MPAPNYKRAIMQFMQRKRPGETLSPAEILKRAKCPARNTAPRRNLKSLIADGSLHISSYRIEIVRTAPDARPVKAQVVPLIELGPQPGCPAEEPHDDDIEDALHEAIEQHESRFRPSAVKASLSGASLAQIFGVVTGNCEMLACAA